MAPLFWLGGRFLRDDLGADPIAAVLNSLGFYTLCVLLAALTCTPLQIVFHWKWPIRVRRMVGLWAFAYAAMHLVTYVVIDQGLDIGAIAKDIVKRPFITVGFAAFLILFALAVTSPVRMVKRLGFRSWKRLHRAVYLAGVLGCVHYLWRFKLKESGPKLAFAVLFVLLLVRVIDLVRKRSQVFLPSRVSPRPV